MSGETTEKKYGRYQKLNKHNITEKKVYTKEEIKGFLKNYTKCEANQIPLHSHVRYFSAVRDANKQIVKNRKGEPTITFKRGGFVKSKHIETNDGKTTGYLMMSSKPHTDHTGTAYNWPAPVDEYSTFFKINVVTKQQLEQNLQSKDNEIMALKKRLQAIEGGMSSVSLS